MKQYVKTFEGFISGVKNSSTKIFENMKKEKEINFKKPEEVDKEAIIKSQETFGPNHRVEVDMAKYEKYKAEGKSLYCFDTNTFKLIPVEIHAGIGIATSDVSFFMKPEMVEEFNNIGANFESIIEKQKKIFWSTVIHAAAGKMSVIEDLHSMFVDIVKKAK